MKNRAKYYIINLLLLVASIFYASSSDAVTLRYLDTAGTTLNYTLSLNNPGPQVSQSVSLTITREVTGVDVSEVMDINTSFSNGTLVINGTTKPFPINGQVLNTKMTRLGEIIETTAMGQYGNLVTQVGSSTINASTDIFRGLGILEFPVDDVPVGGNWTVNRNQVLPNGDSFNISYTYTLNGLVSYRGYDCAEIAVSSQPTISFYQDFPEMRRGMQVNGVVKISGTLLFAYSEGRIIKLNETVETNSVSTMVTFEGAANVTPVYQKTSIALEIQ